MDIHLNIRSNQKEEIFRLDEKQNTYFSLKDTNKLMVKKWREPMSQ